MDGFDLIRNPTDAPGFDNPTDAPGFDPAFLRAHRPDACCLAGGARCSLWWTEAPPLAGYRLGVIGHYAAEDDGSARLLLDRACRELADRGCTLVVGPMDGNTWRRYRFVAERGPEPPFLMEPDNPDAYPAQWTDAGFAPLAHYSSALNEDLAREDPRVPEIRRRMAAEGVRLRPVDPARLDEELRRIYALSIVAFAQNYLYTPIGEDEFVDQYRQAAAFLRPELVLLAERGDELVGYLFGIPDLLQARRNAAVDTVILKTVAVLPGRAYAGLGSLLSAEAHAAARALGFRRAIHALMHDSNGSRNISDRFARPIRRYTLFARALA